MKIKKYNKEEIIKKIKYWNILYILGIFFLTLCISAVILSTIYVALVIILFSTPICFFIVMSKQELNYYRTLLEIRSGLDKYNEDR